MHFLKTGFFAKNTLNISEKEPKKDQKTFLGSSRYRRDNQT